MNLLKYKPECDLNWRPHESDRGWTVFFDDDDQARLGSATAVKINRSWITWRSDDMTVGGKNEWKMNGIGWMQPSPVAAVEYQLVMCSQELKDAISPSLYGGARCTKDPVPVVERLESLASLYRSALAQQTRRVQR